MFLLRRRKPVVVILVLIVLMVSGGVLWAGDVASFVDLGFSEDGKIYMFAQYGVDEHTLRPWAELYIVDVDSNDFVPGGRISYRNDKPVALGQDGSAALLRIVSHNTGIIRKYRTNFMRQGIPLFISLEDIRNLSGQTINFRDFEHSVYYSASLKSMLYGGGPSTKSSFHIFFNSLNGKGVKKTYNVGNPGIKRNGVTTYSIKKVIVNPERTSMILVIEMTVLNGSGADIRYMVEAIRL